MKYPKELYLKYDPFVDRCEILYHKVKIVKTRTEHECMLANLFLDGPPHNIPPGQMARIDEAMVEGEWGRYYSCIPCLEKWLEEQLCEFLEDELRAIREQEAGDANG